MAHPGRGLAAAARCAAVRAGCARIGTPSRAPDLWCRPSFGRVGKFGVCCCLSAPGAERKKIEALYEVFYSKPKKKAREAVSGTFDSFSRFVSNKTKQIRRESGYHCVEYTVKMAERASRAQGKGASLIEQTARVSAHEFVFVSLFLIIRFLIATRWLPRGSLFSTGNPSSKLICCPASLATAGLYY